MKMHKPAILILNAGSSNIKLSLFSIRHQKIAELVYSEQVASLGDLSIKNMPYKIFAAGHRIVHGANKFLTPIIINTEVIKQLEKYIPLAPLHQPLGIEGIKTLKRYMPKLFQVACFDTTFHQTQSDIEKTYALPQNISPIPIQRYGFHGISYEYIAKVLPTYLGKKASTQKIIVAHLGQGASLCALLNQHSVATTMGFSVLDGLPMGTRPGHLDPGIILYLLQNGMSIKDLIELLYKKSGLLGLSGISSDIRVLLNNASPLAANAIEYFIYRTNCELGSLVAALKGLDHLIFTAGIGEHSAEIRQRICDEASWLGILVDKAANRSHHAKISKKKSRVSVWVIPTNEAFVMAQHVLDLWKRHER